MKRFLGLAIVLALGAPFAAYADDGYVVADISLQSGPDSDYPPIENLATGTEVGINGCIEGFSWCDVNVGDDRGWVPGSYLEQMYDNQPVFIADYGPRIGIPVVSFDIGVYWDAHYRNRPFYAQRTEWVNRHIAVRAAPRPSVAHAPPIPNHGAPNRGAPPRPQNATAARPAPPQPDHRAPVRDDQHPPAVAHTTPAEHPAVAPKPEEHAPPKPAEHAAPKPKEEAKPEEHKDDDHGH